MGVYACFRLNRGQKNMFGLGYVSGCVLGYVSGYVSRYASGYVS